jgi:soluble lytic murein transglycosylase
MNRAICLILALSASIIASADETDRLAEQRAAFRQALVSAELGDWDSVRPHLDLLEDYPLRPDLSAAWLRRRVDQDTDAEMARFLARYPDYGFSRDLRYRWARSLARRREWRQFLDLYDNNYADSEDTELHCLALTADIETGQTDDTVSRAKGLWLSAYSQPEECDPVFEFLADGGYLTADLRRQRIALALPEGQIRLARYLARPLAEPDRRMIERWAKMKSDPAGQLARSDRFANNETDREMVVYGFRRLARQDPERARQLLLRYADYPLEPDRRSRVRRDIALTQARRFMPEGRALLEQLPDEDRDPIVAQWRVRLALRDRDWAAALAAIDRLPAGEAERDAWRYWRARSLAAVGDNDAAAAAFDALALERDYYGFLAADHRGKTYRFDHRPTPPREDVIAGIAARPAVVRARELFMTGLYGRGRAEWNAILETLNPEEKAQASILAHRWGWHSRAISTAAGTGLYDDLDLRYPTPWRQLFEPLSREASLEPSFAYGIARSESLFMPDVSSSAGAIGLMQLMPATGKETARQAGIRYRGRISLVDPATNIELGTRYLATMLERFGGNPVLASAAYNAGPHRVSRWLPEEGQLPADVWIDSIPFRETRRYVRRVLSSDTVFDWRFDGEHRRLSERMPPVSADAESRR